ncbi:hypothetical protein [Aquimarina algiphila]|uniref:hypothetical protein n=1 Tax=Aquimarina algiphila TaxID=2047982 RepID=UPI002330B47D|nr:hypothetical protein [Aquimarina algiphila]
MDNKSFNPVIEAVVSIRQLAVSTSENWTAMRKIGASLQNNLYEASKIVENYGSETTKDKWKLEAKAYTENLNQLKSIMESAISKIKEKSTQALSENWNHHHQYSTAIKQSLNELQCIGRISLPENKISIWSDIWSQISDCYKRIENEAQACSIQLKMIEAYTPKEVDVLSNTILNYIPFKYSKEEAHKYTDEYMKAYEDIKKEASKKKNLWDRFLDILAGGMQQTPAQRVMMQRWVNAEKGDLH